MEKHVAPRVTSWNDPRGLRRTVTTPFHLGQEEHDRAIAQWKVMLASDDAQEALRREIERLDMMEQLAKLRAERDAARASQRERIAKAALTGILADADLHADKSMAEVVDLSVYYADMLIARLLDSDPSGSSPEAGEPK